jgi:hypothetical protein
MSLRSSAWSRLGVPLFLVGITAAWALAQQAKPGAGAGGAEPAQVRMEYVNQEVQANAITQTLNDLDSQGWSIFQVIPSWQVKGEGGEAALEPRAYIVFGRRPIRDNK